MVEENISHSINKYSHKMSTNKVLLKLLTKKLYPLFLSKKEC